MELFKKLKSKTEKGIENGADFSKKGIENGADFSKKGRERHRAWN